MKKIQTLEPVRKFLKGYLKRNPNATLRTLYKRVRKIEKVSFIGCWSLINEVVYECAKRDRYFTKKEVVKAFKLTEDSYLKKLRSNSKLVAILTSKDDLRAKFQAD